ncbi:MAG: glycosyltransferase [Desulfuromonadaceae bacterium]|nr:glycosyltransferase [Desulfuromonas sp.]MDY0184863.1 glycosyltransferase [Desulfuromonadaceae bacterium]
MADNNEGITPEISVVIPVFNEEAVLPALFERLYAAMDQIGRSYECVFIDDGSTDRSVALLREQFERRPNSTRVIFFNGNFGQHSAIMAGFKHCHGQIIVTLDADLQNPPEEIANLLAKVEEGHDYVGTIRKKRQDIFWRRIASQLMNKVRHRITKIQMTDQGCMLRAYRRPIIDAINSTSEINTYIPALAYMYAASPVEIEVEHAEREAGESKYSLYKLIRLNFDLVTAFSLVPLQIFSLAGIVLSLGSGMLVMYILLRRLFIGPEVEGVFTLFAITFFLIGILLFGIGLLGEYVGRIYQQVRERPRYLVKGVLEEQPVAEKTEEQART